MGLKEWVRPPRHLLVMFFAVTFVSTAALAWLSWQVVRQDRALAIQRAQEQRENATDLAASALQKHLADLEDRLTALAALPEADESRKVAEYSRNLRADSLVIVFKPEGVGVDVYPAGRLLYYPAIPPSEEPPMEVFAKADAIEFQEKDPARAIAALAGLLRSPNRSIRAEALARLGRNLRKAGRWHEAESAYGELAQFGATPMRGIPAELLARGALSDVLTEQGAREPAVREASALYADLQNGRWQIARPVYDVYADQARRLLGSKIPSLPSPESLALADSVQSLWKQWQSGKGVKRRQTFWAADRSILLVARDSASRLVALAAAPAYLKSGWLGELEPLAESHGARIALVDTDGHAVGDGIDPAGPQSLRLSSVTGLPWTLYAVSVPRASGGAFTGRTQLVIAGLAAIALLVVGGSYLIGRAVSRELAVATQQSDFVTAISHEFRTPLTALRQLSELLSKGRVLNEDVRQQYYAVLEHETARLQRLVEGLLKFGRMEAGAMRYQFETIDTAAFVRALVEEFGREADRHGCRVELRTDGNIPPILADREALSCVIWNLLDNAVKYSPECRTVWVDVARENDRVAIRVRDQGVGISHEDRKRIFQKFVRGNVAKTLGVQGTGIGLAVAQQIVSGHDGEIQIESESGAGSTFTVLLAGVAS
jgi:signal transduction histidine kinase